jgi:hypothetical protein
MPKRVAAARRRIEELKSDVDKERGINGAAGAQIVPLVEGRVLERLLTRLQGAGLCLPPSRMGAVI